LEPWAIAGSSPAMRVEDSQVRKNLMPDKVIRCRFDLNHEVFAGRVVRGHEKVPTGGRVEVTAGGQ
jgi:hypothetical protein